MLSLWALICFSVAMRRETLCLSVVVRSETETEAALQTPHFQDMSANYTAIPQAIFRQIGSLNCKQSQYFFIFFCKNATIIALHWVGVSSPYEALWSIYLHSQLAHFKAGPEQCLNLFRALDYCWWQFCGRRLKQGLTQIKVRVYCWLYFDF